MHSIDELLEFGLTARVTLPLKRWGYVYVEDLLGTKPFRTTIAHGCEPAPGGPGWKYWPKDFWHDEWLNIPRIKSVAIGNMLLALDKWKEHQRGKPVAER
jgi:hypothetical protein